MTDFEFPLDGDDDGDGFPPDDDGGAAPVEPGRPSPENVAFVLLGVAATVAVVYHLATLFG